MEFIFAGEEYVCGKRGMKNLRDTPRRIILTSYGLTSGVGRKLIGKALADVDLSEKKIFVFHEPHEFLADAMREACISMGFKRENVILSGEQSNNDELLEMDYLYITSGNTFEILSLLRERGLDDIYREAFRRGASFIGSSAGAMIAGESIEEASSFDRNFVGMTDFRGLSLFKGIVIPHYNKSELKRYIRNSPGILQKYTRILSVANERMLILEE